MKPFDGEGAYRFGARWSSPGVRLTYAAEHFVAALAAIADADGLAAIGDEFVAGQRAALLTVPSSKTFQYDLRFFQLRLRC